MMYNKSVNKRKFIKQQNKLNNTKQKEKQKQNERI